MASAKPRQEQGSSDVFKSIFGISSEITTLPLFACNNFRRRPEPCLQQSEASNQRSPVINPEEKTITEHSNNVAATSPRIAVSVKGENWTPGKDRRRKSISDLPQVESRREKKQRKNDEEVETPVSKKKNDRKRKRAEIEEEYETRKYGFVEEENSKMGSSMPGAGQKRKTLDDSVKDMVVSADCYDDESKLQRTVFVGNLPVKVKKQSLLKEFSHFGQIQSVRIRSVPLLDSKIPRKGAIIKGKINDAVDSVHAYIVFKEEKSADAALCRNMTEFGGHHIRVDRACPPRKKLRVGAAPLYDNTRTLFVGNLPFDVKDEELYQLFNGLNKVESNVEAIRVVRDSHSSKGKGVAYVLFKTRDAVNFLVKEELKLRDRTLRLSHSKSGKLESKRKKRTPAYSGTSGNKRRAFASEEGSAKVRAAPLSYQGLQTSKCGKHSNVQWKTLRHREVGAKRKVHNEANIRKTKRPAVALRKLNLLKRKLEGDSSGNVGKKKARHGA